MSTASAAAIPSGSKKIVQNLKEIVNCSEAEIYAMLKECNMDPSEAVHRLLNQDTFHEVKSKREKKKEMKETPDSRSRSVYNNPSRGVRGGRTSSSQHSSNDYGVSYGKPIPKKENGTNAIPAGSTLNLRRSSVYSEGAPLPNKPQSHITIANDGPPLPSQPPSGFQNTWSKVPGQMSMADIVRMGKPQVKPSSTPTDSFMPNVSQQISKLAPSIPIPSESVDPIPYNEEKSPYDSHDNWSTHEEISGVEPSASSTLHVEEPSNFEREPCIDENQIGGGGDYEDSRTVSNSSRTGSNRSASVSDEEFEIDNSGDGAVQDDGQPHVIDSYHPRMHGFVPHEVEDASEEISSATANLQQLNLQERDLSTTSTEDNPSVIIPSHLQVNADFSHLSFGSFGSNINNTTSSGSFPSNHLRNNNLDMAPVPEEATLDQLNSRNSEYYDNDQLKSALDENVTSTGTYDVPSVSQPEAVREEAHGLQGNFQSDADYSFSTTTQPTATYSYPDLNSQMHNLSPFSTLMPPYTNSIPSSLLAANAPPLREFDLPFSALHATQSLATQYNTATPSISGTISMPEVKPESLSSLQQTQQTLPASNIHPSLAQHLPIHTYSQPSLPLGHFANMIGYPFLPQNYYLPYAASNSPFLQSQAAAAAAAAMKYSSALPQYKTGLSGSNLAQSPALPPGYGGFTSSTNNIPGNFNLNQSTGSGSTAVGFEEPLSSHYKDGSHYLPLQHNDNSAMWVHGAGSRGVSAMPGNTFYGFQGQQSQQSAAFRQAPQQHPSPQFAQMGYLNLYQSQGGPTQEQHQQQQQQPQQNHSEGNMSGSQGQMWQHGY